MMRALGLGLLSALWAWLLLSVTTTHCQYSDDIMTSMMTTISVLISHLLHLLCESGFPVNGIFASIGNFGIGIGIGIGTCATSLMVIGIFACTIFTAAIVASHLSRLYHFLLVFVACTSFCWLLVLHHFLFAFLRVHFLL